METYIRVLSDADQDQVHEKTVKILAETGVKVESDLGRDYLKNAGAGVDENTKIVRIPQRLLEECLQTAPKKFSLGARRPDWGLGMNEGECYLMPDGEGITIIDHRTRDERPGTFADWLDATRVIDALDEVSAYWAMIEQGDKRGTLADSVQYWISIFRNFSKHVQDSSPNAATSSWLLEILQAVFGDKDTIRNTHPFSFLVCPQSPLMIDAQHTDAYLATKGWNIPLAIMPMPLMGGTGPGNMISMTIQGNCEVLAMLCLAQVVEPGAPIIYAPALAVMNPRSGLYSAGAIEGGLLSCAAIEMGKYYQLPVEGSGGGTDTFTPSIQGSYERALNILPAMLSWPDLMVGCGLMGGSMVMSLEQLLIDVEIFRMNKQLHRGIPSQSEAWLDEVIQKVGPGGNYLGEKSTVKNMRSGEWLIPHLGMHETHKAWQSSGKKDILDETREKVDQILKTHKPLPLGDDIEKELAGILKKAKEIS
jgi:trimethylamine--corrinoid protein Co-methyltransferase